MSRSSKAFFIVSVLFALNMVILQYLTQLEFCYSTSDKPNHLIVIQHGLNYPAIVNYPTFYFLRNHLSNDENKENKYNEDEYMIYVAHSNSSPHLFSFLYHTNNGIVHAATNLANEIYQLITNNHQYSNINKISFIGSSIGGNYIRYTAYLLSSNPSYYINNTPFFIKIKPINLVTLAAPHFGIQDWFKIPQQFIHFLSKYSPSLTLKELLNIDQHRVVDEMNKKHSVFALFDKVLIFYNSGWDSLVSCESSSIDFDGSHCQITKDYCDQNRDNVFDLTLLDTLNNHNNNNNGTFQRIPICLKRNPFEQVMAHAILSLSIPPISHNMVDLLTSK